jgi:hypothetical protein
MLPGAKPRLHREDPYPGGEKNKNRKLEKEKLKKERRKKREEGMTSHGKQR